jgi:hypothetical protein
MATQTQYHALVTDLIRRITSLVRDRNLLLQQHADTTKLERASAEIERLQWRLARIVQSQQSHQLAA